MTRLTTEEIDAALAQLPGWSVREGKLTKTYKVRSFPHAVVFIGAIGQLAEADNHHPDLFLHDYSQVTVTLVDHHDSGISEKCTKLAANIDALPHRKLETGKKD